MITAMGDVMRRAYDKGWITTRDGNISLRRSGSNIMYVTPSGWRKTIIHPEHMIKVKLENSMGVDTIQILDDHAKPSGELEMHINLQKLHNRTRAVVHLHPTNIIAAMFAGWDLQHLASIFPEVSRYTRVGPTVPVLPVTSTELAEATWLAFTTSKDPSTQAPAFPRRVCYDIVGQAAHGVCAIGPNPWDAFEHIERLEHICEIVLKSGVRPKATWEKFKND
jgi:ribulose-5-phosphate 4-epimerase/fuculose-1-phosphate aldolase